MQVETISIKDVSGVQTISLPENFRIDDDMVYLKQVGNVIYIIPYHNPWQVMFYSLDKFSADFMEERLQPNS
jgi:antitoxin VapB